MLTMQMTEREQISFLYYELIDTKQKLEQEEKDKLEILTDRET